MSSESLVEVFPNEMLARLWADILSNEGIPSFVKPHFAGYGGWGPDSFIPHGLYVPGEHIEGARDSIRDSEGEKL
jgi:hypothetical protein